MGVQAIKLKRNPFDRKETEQRIDGALDAGAKYTQTMLETTVATWKHKVEFTITSPRPFVREVATDDEIYHYVSGGTRPHDIAPRNAQSLAIGVGSAPKTAPGVIGSTNGRKAQGRRILPRGMVVHHPGTKAREFPQKIAPFAAKRLREELRQRLKG